MSRFLRWIAGPCRLFDISPAVASIGGPCNFPRRGVYRKTAHLLPLPVEIPIPPFFVFPRPLSYIGRDSSAAATETVYKPICLSFSFFFKRGCLLLIRGIGIDVSLRWFRLAIYLSFMLPPWSWGIGENTFV